MGFNHRIYPNYDPTSSALVPLPDQWLDASDTTTLDKAGPLPITNGATVFEWRDKSATARQYRLVGPNTAPTWESNVVRSLGGVKCDHQVLSSLNLTGMRNLSGRTMVGVFKQIQNEHLSTTGLGFTVTEPHVSANANNPTNTLAAATGGFGGGCRRVQGDSVVNSASLLGDGVTVRPVNDGDVFFVVGAIDYANGKQFYYPNGCGAMQLATNLASSGNTNSTIDPFAMTVGGYLKESPTLNGADGMCRAYILEILDWFQLLTLAQIVPVRSYLSKKWGVG